MPRQAFDHYAYTYDSEFTHSPIGQIQRERVYRFLTPYLRTNKQILELNCGTGHDALYLAERGHTITAIDISEDMINVAKGKTTGKNPTFICADLQNLKALHLPKQDLVFSNFGGLNCISPKAFTALSESLNDLLLPGGMFVAVIMGTNCLWEDVYFKRISHPGYRRRKRSEGVSTSVNGLTFTTWYYSPQQVTAFLNEHFTTERIMPVGLWVPPSYLNYYFAKRPLLLKGLYALERLFAGFSSLANSADHYCILLKRRH